MGDDEEGAGEKPAEESGPPGCRWTAGGTIADYSVVRSVARGSLGEVYRVRSGSDVDLQLRWIFGPGKGAAGPIRDCAALSTRHLLNVIDVRAVEGGIAVVTEPYPETLRDELARGPLEPADGIECATIILRALVALEEREIAPLVLSPESVAVWPDGYALDEFYLAAAYPPGSRPVPLDRAIYLPPDLSTDAPKASDALWGLGATLFEALAGRPLLTGPAFEIIARASRGEFQIDLEEPFRSLIASLLEPRGDRRPRSARLVLERLDSFGTASFPIAASHSGGAALEVPSIAPTAPADTGPALEPTGKNDQGLPTFLRHPGRIPMVLLPGGAFEMGSQAGEQFGRDNEAPVIQVTLEPFLMDESPLRWGELDQLLSIATSHVLHRDRGRLLPKRFGGQSGSSWRWATDAEVETTIEDGQPVVMVTHAEAASLARELGVELPSEAEWEYACRGGTRTEYWWGDTPDSEKAWCNANTGKLPVVGRMPRNPFGLLDIAGTVSEFCRDFFHRDVYAKVAAGSSPTTTRELANGISSPSPRRSLRGGGWKSGPRALRSAFRAGVDEDGPSVSNGCRFVIRKAKAPAWAASAFETAG